MGLPLEIAQSALRGDFDTVRQFVESSPERVNDLEENDKGSISLLSLAITADRVPRAVSAEMVRYLISRGADVECRNLKQAPLYYACIFCHVEAVSLLLQAGANLHRIDERGSVHRYLPFSSYSIQSLLSVQTLEQATVSIFEFLRLLLRAGLSLDSLRDGTTTPLEQIIDELNQSGHIAGHLGRSLDLVRAMRASMHTSASPRLSPWRQYVLAPSVAVLRLRSLVARGRARERGVVSGPTPRPIAWLLAPRTPPEIVWNVLAFWNPRHE